MRGTSRSNGIHATILEILTPGYFKLCCDLFRWRGTQSRSSISPFNDRRTPCKSRAEND
jgi:hypothetical protein